MKQNLRVRKVFALLLCLVMTASFLAVPVLADEETSASGAEAPAATVEAPAKAEAPAAKEEAPAAKVETSTKEETPAVKVETPAKEETSTKEETPAVKVETPAKEETSTKEETPAVKEETPAKEETSTKEETPAVKEEAPVAAAPSEEPAPAATPTPAVTTPSAPRPIRLPAAVQVAETAPATTTAPAASVSSTQSTAAGNDPAAADDGFSVDWDEVGLMDGGDWQVSKWGIARGEDGYWVYLENDQSQVSVGITYYNDSSDAIRYRGWIANGRSLLGENELPIKNSTLTVINEGGRCRMEGFIPDSFFKSGRFILSSGSVTLRSEDIPKLADATDVDLSDDVYNESHKEADPDTKAQAIGAAYTGITIDGDFSDWDAVPRYELKDTYDIWGNVKNYDTVDQVSVVWDGDYVYILLVAEGAPADYDPSVQVGNWSSVTGAGPNNNGQFAIVTDLNQQLLVQPAVDHTTGEPTVNGIDDAQVAVNNKEWLGAPHMWEIAIPAQRLPKYLENFDFGLYLVEPAISGITDLRSGSDEDKSFNGIVNDGKFADWTYYPMTTIQYATPGTQDVVRDAHGALWGDGTTLYGYVATNMIAHLGAHGGEFLGDIVLAFNGDRSYKEYPTDGNFYPRIVAFDDLDRISPNAVEYTADGGAFITLTPGFELADGDYTFYIFDTRTAPSAGNYDLQSNSSSYPSVADLRQQAFGTIKIHIDGVLDQAEFELDLEKVADYIGADADTAFKVIEIQWGRLGQQWIAYAGTPTGPIISVALLVGAVCIPMGYAELKKRRKAQAGSAK